MNKFDWHILIPWAKALTTFTVGYLIAKMLSRLAKRFYSQLLTPQQVMLIQKIIFFGLLILFLMISLQQLDFKLSVLLGSAGIFTAAVGFASQTSMSNLVSGLFLILEQSFEVGDTIIVKSTSGKVISIDLLSVKVQTPQNTLIRLPNSLIISNELTNVTKYPNRRLDIIVGVDYSTDITRAKAVLLETGNADPRTLANPAAKVIVKEMADSSVNLRLSVWARKSDYYDLEDKLKEAIKGQLEASGITIPFQTLTVQLQNEGLPQLSQTAIEPAHG